MGWGAEECMGEEFKGRSRLVKVILFLMLDSDNGDVTVG